MNKEETIVITMEEYKELLIIKGKYEELKSLYTPQTYPKITYRGEFKDNELTPPYKVTCFGSDVKCID